MQNAILLLPLSGLDACALSRHCEQVLVAGGLTSLDSVDPLYEVCETIVATTRDPTNWLH